MSFNIKYIWVSSYKKIKLGFLILNLLKKIAIGIDIRDQS